LVEDSEDDAELLRRALREDPFDIAHVESVTAAAAALHEKPFDVVLLDLSLPDSQGFESFLKIRTHAHEAAIIVLTGLDDETLGLKTVQAGAQDFVVKGTLSGPLMMRAIRHALERKRAEAVTLEYARALAARNEQMREDLQLAREVQQAFLPSRCPDFPIGSASPSLQFVHRYVPAGAVGGDFFDVFPLAPEVAGIIVCDVMGHGVRAALVTALLRAMVGPAAASAHDPSAMLTDLNERLRQILRGCDSVLFVTAAYLVVNAVTGEVRMANAGHPKPARVPLSLSAAAAASEPYPIGPPLGLVETPKYETHRFQLTAGERLLLFTDGVYEVEGPGGETFGQARLQNLLQSQSSLGAEPFLDTVLEKVRAHAVDGEFTDDACLLAIDFRRSA